MRTRTDPLTVATRKLTDQHQSPPCRTDPDAWFSEHRATIAEAIEACHRCPVIEQCRQAAADHVATHGPAHTYGVWAGVHHRGHAHTRKAVS